MSTVKGIRLKNALLGGAIAENELETLLADPGNLGPFIEQINLRGAIRSLAQTDAAMVRVAESSTAVDAVFAYPTPAAAISGSPVAVDRFAGVQAGMAGLIASPGGFDLVIASPAAVAAMVASPGAMGEVAASQLAVDAVIADADALDAVTTSQVAMDAFAASQLAVDAVVADPDALGAVTASQVAMDALAASALAMVSFADSQDAVDAVIVAPVALATVVDSAVAMEAFAATQLAVDGVIADPVALAAVIESPVAMAAFADSQIAMEAFAASQDIVDDVIAEPVALAAVANAQEAMDAFAASKLAMDSVYASPAAVAEIFGAQRYAIYGPHPSQITVTGSGVSLWADASGNNRNYVQTSDSARPPYTGTLGDYTVPFFDGSQDFLQTNGGIWTLGDNWVALTVYRLATVSSTAAILGGTASLDSLAANNIEGQARFISNEQPQTPVSVHATNTFGLVTWSAVAPDSINGVSAGNAPDFANSNSAYLGLGRGAVTAGYYNGDIAEIVIWTAGFDQADVDRVTRMLKIKYGLPL